MRRRCSMGTSTSIRSLIRNRPKIDRAQPHGLQRLMPENVKERRRQPVREFPAVREIEADEQGLADDRGPRLDLRGSAPVSGTPIRSDRSASPSDKTAISVPTSPMRSLAPFAKTTFKTLPRPERSVAVANEMTSRSRGTSFESWATIAFSRGSIESSTAGCVAAPTVGDAGAAGNGRSRSGAGR
jgi:hypothetical protein